MQAVANPIALELADEVKKAVTPNEFVNDALNRRNELEQLKDYMKRREQRAAQAEKQKLAEEMLITAFQNAVPFQAIEAMRQSARITEARLAELKNQAQMP
ncbi:MAG: hypothetical protein FWG65_04835 [Turicibacter sp.]|nr:hypothetical protein [Turicibacter sp.]